MVWVKGFCECVVVFKYSFKNVIILVVMVFGL